MKKIKKLTLNKEVASILGGNEMNMVKGGTYTTTTVVPPDPPTPPPTPTPPDSASCYGSCNGITCI